MSDRTLPQRKKSRLLRWLLAVVLLIAVAVTAFWLWSASELETALARWRADQEARGYVIAYRPPEISGFPLKLAAALEQPSVAAPGGWRWQGPALAAEARIWSPLTIDFAAPGAHSLVVLAGEAPRHYDIEAVRAEGEARLNRAGRLIAGRLEFGGLTIATPEDERASAVALSAVIEEPRLEAGRLPATPFALELSDLALPEQRRAILGNDVQRLELNAMLNGTLPAAPAREMLGLWRDAGGTLEIRALELDYGPLKLRGEGTLTLDEQFRPLGAFTTRIGGLTATITKLSQAGAIERGVAVALALALATLPTTPDSDGTPLVALPVTCQDGWLFLGPVRLVPLAPVL
ncbi:MAG: DUF2125 domain-containing protein [Kiloniellales bacterium]